jgi:poly(3-hydroxybutyrate) depolymerase
VAPTVPPSGRVVSYPGNCWNWFGTGHTRQADDAAKLLQLVDALKRRPELSIDAQQVYVSGLSAGGGESHVLACLAPEVFAGMGLVATPALGSAALDVGGSPKRSAAQVAETCRALAGSQSAHLGTQIASLLYGTSDYVVNPQHNVVNAEGMRLVYGTGATRTSFNVAGGGTGSWWADGQGHPRVSLVSVSGMDHSWPAGPTGTQNTNYVNNRYLNYPEYLSQYLFDHNLRVGPGGGGEHPVPPPVQSITASVVEHYSARRITLQQYLAMGARLGYTTRVTLYRCSSGWSESASCA